MLNEYAPAQASLLWHLTDKSRLCLGRPLLLTQSPWGDPQASLQGLGTGLLPSYTVPRARGGRDARSVWEAGAEGLHGCRSPSLTEALTSGRSSSEPLPGETGDRRLRALPDVRQEIKTNSSELGLQGLGSKPPEAE